MQQSKMTINEFIKEVTKLFGSVQYKATSKDGRVFKSQGYEKAVSKINLTKRN